MGSDLGGLSFTNFFEHAMDVGCVLHSDSTIVTGNPAFLRTMGYSEEQLIGKLFFSFVHREDLERVRELFKSLVFGATSLGLECRIKMYGGNYCWFEWSVTKIEDGVFLCLGRDVQSRNVLFDELQQLAQVARLTDDIVIITNPVGQTEWVNRGFTDTTGYSLEEIKGKKPGSLLQGKETSQADIEKVCKGLVGHKPFTQEILNYTKAGKPYWVEMNISPVKNGDDVVTHFLMIGHDVTDQKKYEQLLERGLHDMQMFQLALDNASDLVIISDHDGLVIYANAAAEDVTGFSLTEILGTKAGSLWGGLMPKEYYAEMWQAIRIRKNVFRGEIRNRRKDGTEYISDLHISPILDDSGEVVFFVAIERDITKQKEVDRMKSEFITLASHQLRTPLTAINWLLETLLQQTASFSEQQKKLVRMISASNNRMVELVNSLLNVSRIESGKIRINPEDVDLRRLLGEIVEELTIKENRGHKVNIDISDAVGTVPLDKGLTSIVYGTLISNALHYSPDDSEISVKVYREEGKLVTRVEDHGVGIPLAEQNRVYERFFRAENIKPVHTDGNGLSLYLVKLICDIIGGEIRFESKEEVGTTFWYSIPQVGMKQKDGEVTVS